MNRKNSLHSQIRRIIPLMKNYLVIHYDERLAFYPYCRANQRLVHIPAISLSPTLYLCLGVQGVALLDHLLDYLVELLSELNRHHMSLSLKEGLANTAFLTT